MKKWSALLLSVLFASSVWATSISKLVIFGDSLSDNGNSFEYTKHQLPPAPWYYKGRFSNGPIWIDRLADQFFENPVSPSQILNYAFGGAGTLRMQASSFLLSQEIDSYVLTHPSQAGVDSLFMIWIGANDYLTMPDATESDIKQVIQQIKLNSVRLVAHGAKHVMIIGLPDLGLTPFAKELELTDAFSVMTQSHNQQLQHMLSALQTEYPVVDWIYFDMNQLFMDVHNQPQSYGLSNVTDKCLQMLPTRKGASKIDADMRHVPRFARDCDTYLFLDQLHPTAAVHQLIANHMDKLLQTHDLHAFREPQ